MNNKGFTILEYIVYIPIVLIVTVSLYMLIDTVLTTNVNISSQLEFSSEELILDTSIMKDIAKGHNEVSYIDGDKSRGFILNGTEYDFTTTDFIDFKVLSISCDIQEHILTITTKCGEQTFVKRYNTKYWGSDYD